MNTQATTSVHVSLGYVALVAFYFSYTLTAFLTLPLMVTSFVVITNSCAYLLYLAGIINYRDDFARLPTLALVTLAMGVADYIAAAATLLIGNLCWVIQRKIK